jgi:hypothetical protein
MEKSSAIIRTATVAIIAKGISFKMVFRRMPIGVIAADMPKTNKIFKMFDPMTLPKTSPFDWSIAALMLTASSGALVPKATKVKPITIVEILNRLAIEAAPSTKKSAPLMSNKKPIISKIISIMLSPLNVL